MRFVMFEYLPISWKLWYTSVKDATEHTFLEYEYWSKVFYQKGKETRGHIGFLVKEKDV